MPSLVSRRTARLAAAALALVGLGFAAGPLSAQKAPKQVRVTGDFSFVNASGNSDLTTLSGSEKLQITSRDSLWRFEQTGAAVYGRSRDSTTAGTYSASARLDRELSPRLSVFAAGTWLRNRFAGIGRRFEELLGLAGQLVAEDRDKLDVEVGAAITQQRSTAGVDDNFVAARVAGRYKHLLTDKAFFQQKAEFLPNLQTSSDYRINSETSLVAPLSTAIALTMSYVVRFDNLPEPGFKKTDRLLSSGIQVTF